LKTIISACVQHLAIRNRVTDMFFLKLKEKYIRN
jgi:hypothetical protein